MPALFSGFIVDDDDTRDDDDIRANDVRRRPMPHPSSMMEDEDREAVEEYVRNLQERSRYGTTRHSDYDEEVTEVEQQALLPSVKDPKLWMVKCAVGFLRVLEELSLLHHLFFVHLNITDIYL